MNFLIIYGHPNPKSFNHAILKTLTEALAARGQEIRQRDLYALGFDPLLKAEELAGFEKGRYPADILAEQAHVRWADVLIFIGPIWWGGLPAILRGYCERVFSLGFAYEETSSGPRGLLAGKKGYVINTIGAPLKIYEEIGMLKSMRQTIGEVVFDFCAIKSLGHKFFGSVGTVTAAERQAMLEELKVTAEELIAKIQKDSW